MKDSLGVITGRFQGLHLGHMEYLLAGAERCGHLIVGVTNSAPWEEAPAELQGMARVKQSSNPFTFYERMVMLRDSLTEAGLPRESFEKLRSYNDNPYVLFFPGASDNEYYWGVYFTPLDFAADVDRIFSSLYFERMRVPNAHGTPEEIVAHLEQERREAQDKLEVVRQRMAALWEREAPMCMQVYARLRQKNYYFSIRKYAARYNDKFILTGWIPRQEEKGFRTALDRIDGIEYSFERPDQDSSIRKVVPRTD